VRDCRRCDQSIDVPALPQGRDAAPFQGDQVRDRQDSIRMIVPRALKPFFETICGPRVCFPFESDAPHNFTQGERAKIERVRRNGSQPRRPLAAASASLRHDIRVDEIHLNGEVAARRLRAGADGDREVVVPRRA